MCLVIFWVEIVRTTTWISGEVKSFRYITEPVSTTGQSFDFLGCSRKLDFRQDLVPDQLIQQATYQSHVAQVVQFRLQFHGYKGSEKLPDIENKNEKNGLKTRYRLSQPAHGAIGGTWRSARNVPGDSR